jgi:hypothetical protein
MKLALTVAQQALFIAVPVISSLAAISLPAQANTSASSGIDTTLNGFSQPSFDLDTLTDTDAFAIGPGAVTTDAEAIADAFSDEWFGFSSAETNGTGVNYQGAAIGQSFLAGNFWVKEHQPFSFDFSTQIELATIVTNPLIETATALGKIQFNLYNNATDQLLDSFSFFGKLTPQLSGNPFSAERSDYVTLIDLSNIATSNTTSSTASAKFVGTYNRTFDGSLDLRLEAFQASAATVEAVPEPDYIISSFVLLLLFPAIRYFRNKRASVAE